MLSLSMLSFSVWFLACGEKEPEVDPLTIDDDGDGFSENDGTKESSYNQNIPNPPQSTTAKVVFHERDNNDDSKLQSTGTAYVLHGGMTDRSLNTGGSGLRAIRALRKK